MRVRGVVVCVLGVALASGVARAQDTPGQDVGIQESAAQDTAAQDTAALDEADRLFDLGEADAARAAYEAAIESGELSPDALSLACRQLGVIAAALAESELATRWFEKALAIDPSQPVPDALSPSQQVIFEAAQARQRLGELSVSVQQEAERTRLSLATAHFPSGWIRRYRVASPDWTTTEDGPAITVPRAVLESPNAVRVQVYALDAFGNTVAAASATLQPAPVVVATVPEEPPQRNRTGLWVTITALAVVAVAAAIIVPLAVRGQDEGYGVPVIEW